MFPGSFLSLTVQHNFVYDVGVANSYCNFVAVVALPFVFHKIQCLGYVISEFIEFVVLHAKNAMAKTKLVTKYTVSPIKSALHGKFFYESIQANFV